MSLRKGGLHVLRVLWKNFKTSLVCSWWLRVRLTKWRFLNSGHRESVMLLKAERQASLDRFTFSYKIDHREAEKLHWRD